MNYKTTELDERKVPAVCAFVDTMKEPCIDCSPECDSYLGTEKKKRAWEEKELDNYITRQSRQ